MTSEQIKHLRLKKAWKEDMTYLYSFFDVTFTTYEDSYTSFAVVFNGHTGPDIVFSDIRLYDDFSHYLSSEPKYFEYSMDGLLIEEVEVTWIPSRRVRDKTSDTSLLF